MWAFKIKNNEKYNKSFSFVHDKLVVLWKIKSTRKIVRKVIF